MQETKLVKSSRIKFEEEAKIIEIMWRFKAVELTDDEANPLEEEESSQIIRER